MDVSISELVFFVVLAVISGIYYQFTERPKDILARMRASAMLELQRFKLNSGLHELSLDGSRDQLVKTIEEVFDVDDVPTEITIHCYLRNVHGEYFYVLLRSADTTYGKHISHEAARVVLKDKYVAQEEERQGQS
jgi:hypothetical protein